MIGIGISIPMMMPFAEDATAFVRSGVLRSPFIITRAQTGGVQSTAINGANSGLTFYGADVPRFTGPAQRLLIEGQSINRVQQPVAVSNPTGAWFQFNGTATPTITLNFSVSPGGLQNAARVRWVGPNVGAVSLRVPTSGLSVGTTCTASLYVFTRSLGNATSTSLDLMDGAGSANLLSQFVLNQWSRVVAAGVVSGTSATSQWVDLAFQGFTAGEIDIELWGDQVEEGSFATSLVLPPAATPGASTRGADLVSASLASLGISASGACTVLWSGVVPNFITGATHTIACLDDGSVNNRFTMRIDQASGQLQAQRSLAGASTTANAGAVTAGAVIKGGMALNGSGRAAVSLNGGAVAAVTGGPSSGLTQCRLGNIFDGSAPMFGETTSLRILPNSVSDSDLQTLTGAMP